MAYADCTYRRTASVQPRFRQQILRGFGVAFLLLDIAGLSRDVAGKNFQGGYGYLRHLALPVPHLCLHDDIGGIECTV